MTLLPTLRRWWWYPLGTHTYVAFDARLGGRFGGNPPGMATTTRLINASADRVYAVLSDGWTYSDWVVGTAHIRQVDAGWPRPGTEIHHKAGPWPVSIRDRTTVVASEPGRSLLMKVRLWPAGAGEVRIDLE